MQKSKILDVIKTFEAKDYRRVKDLLKSPFFNKNEELIPFFEYLHKHSKHFDSKKLIEKKFTNLYFLSINMNRKTF